ncbi:hypothetical protein PsorP6_004022 [Peronosclerospora sorghi]|uniref:Uncharacterized protein n=1 Tax=Peronosclerospora sorghi TaxID=230839 RepID=A0ACC0VPS8_9STRA|nr:hypothetical protein PsorP6_004022 [Peronosclerospora sorghi]
MQAFEVVHPVSGTIMAAPQGKTIFVLYSLIGEEIEIIKESVPQRDPDTSWNAFVLSQPPAGGRVALADVQKAFPLGRNFHFSFRCKDGAYLDFTNPDSAVPFCGRKIVARITPLDEEPSVEYLHYEDIPCDVPPPVKPRTESYGSSTAECIRSDDYEEFESTTYESQDEDSGAPLEISSLHDKVRKANAAQSDWNRDNYRNEDSTFRDDNRYSKFDRDTRYDSSEGEGSHQQSEWGEVSKDAQAFLRKQTEQAYDFAKKLSIEDATRGATETAKKAKKWGGSLLSSISSTISNASVSVTKCEIIHLGGVSVQVVRLLAEDVRTQVLLVRSTATSDTFVLKRIICHSQEAESDVRMELRVFRSVKHLNVMPLVEFYESRAHQAMERGSLQEAINDACQSSSPLWPFTQRTALHLFHGICSGVLALHRAGFCHRDIKPENILLSSSSSGHDFLAYIPVVTGFGSCTPIHAEVESTRNSPELHEDAVRKSSGPYRAPELFESIVDVVLDGRYTMAFGTIPFEHPREGFMKLACLNGRVSFPPERSGIVHHRGAQFTVEFCDFIRDMLHTNPEERPSVLDALEFTEELLNDEVR